jgi:hypothetical protein
LASDPALCWFPEPVVDSLAGLETLTPRIARLQLGGAVGKTGLFGNMFILTMPGCPKKPSKAGYNSKLDRKL